MASPTQSLQAVGIIWILPRHFFERRNVIAFEFASFFARNASVTVTLEDGAADGLPAASVETEVVTTHVAHL